MGALADTNKVSRMAIVGKTDVSNDEKDGRDLMQPPLSAPTMARDRKEDWIGRQLRRVFDDTLSEPLPDDIMSLLDRIDEQSAPQTLADHVAGGSKSAPDNHSDA